ncbi:MAG: YceI family protein [Ferruginibacter sp.]
MKILFTIVYFWAATGIATAQTYHLRDDSSTVQFSIKNFGLTVTGSFKGLEGKIIFNPADAATASFESSVTAASVNTGNNTRDNHLKKEDYFDIQNYPRLTFVSSKVSGNGQNYIMEGKLTIKGITKSISFPFTVTATTTGLRFTGQFRINRRDFKVGGGSLILSDELTVTLNVLAVK